MSFGIVLAGTLLVELLVLRRLRFDKFVVAIVLAGTLVYVNYLGVTSLAERNVDGPSHAQYVRLVAERLRLPDVSACGACAHPPLYYSLAALWSGAVGAGGWISFELALQWLSLLLFFGFVVVALLIFRSSFGTPGPLWLATALVVFWPSSIINSVRVHNDALAAPLMLAAIYFTAQWDRYGRARDFAAALAVAALALLAKSTGYATAALLVLVTLLRLRENGWRRDDLQRSVGALLVFAAVGLFATGIRESAEPRTACQAVLGHACRGRYVPPVPDSPARFVFFDLPGFVRGSDALTDAPERDYFLNRLASSSLFGVAALEAEFASKRHVTLAVAIRALLLLMLALCAVALPFLRGLAWRKHRVYVAAAAVLFLFVLAFRIRLPNPHHEDFRHVFPALVPFCLGYAGIVQRLGRVRPLLRTLGSALGLSLALASVAFFAQP
ncbi:MAG TPA: hypothetical protein VFZ53_31995 [Polyangiaceae bacterium]